MLSPPTREALFEARTHQGHLTRRWDPHFAPFIFSKAKGRHLINLDKTVEGLIRAGKAMKELTSSGKKVLFVATKKSAKKVIQESAEMLGQPYVTEKWLGGTLSNFRTIKKSVKKMNQIAEQMEKPAYQHLTKREQLMRLRKKKRMEIALAGIASINRLPSALFVVDAKREMTAIKDARAQSILTFGLVDSNSNPDLLDYPIPANDDATSSIVLLLEYLKEKIKEGQEIWQGQLKKSSHPIAY